MTIDSVLFYSERIDFDPILASLGGKVYSGDGVINFCCCKHKGCRVY